MQTERADSMHKLQADEGISGHLFSGIVEQDRTASIPHSNLTKTNKKHLNALDKFTRLAPVTGY